MIAKREVRLTQIEKKALLDAVELTSAKFGAQWRMISVFGSRVDLDKKGGNIDLYISFDHRDIFDLFQFKLELRREIEDRLGEQKIDIILDDGKRSLGPFGELVMQTKVDLWTKN